MPWHAAPLTDPACAAASGPGEVAGVISAASGLARWREEAAAAEGEVGRVRRALQEVARNVAQLVGAGGGGAACVLAVHDMPLCGLLLLESHDDVSHLEPVRATLTA
jgi:hypothetical protein